MGINFSPEISKIKILINYFKIPHGRGQEAFSLRSSLRQHAPEPLSARNTCAPSMPQLTLATCMLALAAPRSILLFLFDKNFAIYHGI
jgi:hypothetical protein